jgi:parallel beta-helix repeat protein
VYNNSIDGIAVVSDFNVISNCTAFGHKFSDTISNGIYIGGDFLPSILRGAYRAKGNILKYCTITDNEGGVFLALSRYTIIHNNIIANNSINGFGPLLDWFAKIHHNNIFGNGFKYLTGEGGGIIPYWSIVDARNNWWGSSDGPLTPWHDGHGDTAHGWRSLILTGCWLTEPVSDAGRQT